MRPQPVTPAIRLILYDSLGVCVPPAVEGAIPGLDGIVGGPVPGPLVWRGLPEWFLCLGVC